MPFHETVWFLRGRSQSAARWAVIWTQTAIALAICFAIWFTGWSLALTLTYLNTHGLVSYVPGHGMSHVLGHELPHNLLGPIPFVIAVLTLLVNLAIVHVARLFFSIASSEDQIIDLMDYQRASRAVANREPGSETRAVTMRAAVVQDAQSQSHPVESLRARLALEHSAGL
jgi:hypothetical protein